MAGHRSGHNRVVCEKDTDMKNALTLTLIAGTKACPNNCPICISKMTPSHGIEGKDRTPIDVETLRKSLQFALNHRAQNVLITGKGEPTLHPAQVSQYLVEIKGMPFDKRELQTEGSHISHNSMNPMLETWRYLGLDYIAISMFHYEDRLNKIMFRGKGYQMVPLVHKLHEMGYRVRFSCMLVNGFIDCVDEVRNLVSFAKDMNVSQLSLRTIDMPPNPINKETADNVVKYRLSPRQLRRIFKYVRSGLYCDRLPHGAEVWEVEGQNVCITTGLSNDAGKDDCRQLVFFPQGILTASWVTVNGSRIL